MSVRALTATTTHRGDRLHRRSRLRHRCRLDHPGMRRALARARPAGSPPRVGEGARGRVLSGGDVPGLPPGRAGRLGTPMGRHVLAQRRLARPADRRRRPGRPAPAGRARRHHQVDRRAGQRATRSVLAAPARHEQLLPGPPGALPLRRAGEPVDRDLRGRLRARRRRRARHRGRVPAGLVQPRRRSRHRLDARVPVARLPGRAGRGVGDSRLRARGDTEDRDRAGAGRRCRS